jgi:hypothetical protein
MIKIKIKSVMRRWKYFMRVSVHSGRFLGRTELRSEPCLETVRGARKRQFFIHSFHPWLGASRLKVQVVAFLMHVLARELHLQSARSAAKAWREIAK